MSKLIFSNLVALGTLVTVSSLSWVTMWMGLEINLLSVIPLFKNSDNKYPTEAAMKYFFAQALGSSIIIWCVLSCSDHQSLLSPDTPLSLKIMLTTALLIKMAAAPFHFWFPEVIEGINWDISLILMTWQKIAPMVILMNNIHTPILLSMIIISSSIISGIQGINQTSLRKIMAYSSINHTGWMITALISSSETWLIYFSTYTLMTANIIFLMKMFNINKMSQLPQALSSDKNIKFIFFFNFLSLGGLPPFLGFMPKWLTIFQFSGSKFYFTCTILILFTLITLYFYVRAAFTAFSLCTEESLIIFFSNVTIIHIQLNILSLLGLILYASVYSFY
uniref:NADH-ubiquinone oxidoreductase chain 2 n=1 Tax=Curculionoidea sp. 9 KM-2017 TaxID=2219422 RepID=A0A346RGY3_9CUCU|nr:NADH dehydrogenase subunit 2 [Curculionoidea sp. 9 KM-2017]